MKLSKWAESQGISYPTAYRWFRDGNLPVKAYQTVTGTIIVEATLLEDGSNMVNLTQRTRNTMRKDMLSLFDDIFEGVKNPHFPDKKFRVISNKSDMYVLVGEVPGYSEDDIKVLVKDNVITISGKHEVSEEGDNYFSGVLGETSIFESNYSLPNDAVAKKITASCKNGVLEVSIPKHKNGDDAVEIKVKS